MSAATLSAKAGGSSAAAAGQLYRWFWRIHFFSGFFLGPIIIWLAVTGILLAFGADIDTARLRDVQLVTPGAERVSLDRQWIRALASHHLDGMVMQSVEVPAAPDRATIFTFGYPVEATAAAGGHGHGGTTVLTYVDPYTGRVTGTLERYDRFAAIVHDLHARYMAGDAFRWVSEIATSWLLALALTGVYLWWPRRREKVAGVIVPRFKAGARTQWRDWHSIPAAFFFGVIALGAAGGLLMSHLSGTLALGVQFATRQGWPSPKGESIVVAGAPRIGLQAAEEAARANGLAEADLTITPPTTPAGFYRVTNAGHAATTDKVDLAIDTYSGSVLQKITWADYPLMGKLTLLGMLFHAAALGPVVFWVVVLSCVVIVAGSLTSYVMWWKRRPAGGLAAPKALAWRDVPLRWRIAAIVTCVLFPMLGLSLLAFMGLEWGVARVTTWLRTRRAAQARRLEPQTGD